MQTRPDMRGNLKPPTLDLFWLLFRFRVSCTGHDFLFDETVLDPHYETHMATIFLYGFTSSPPTSSFGRGDRRGWRGWLRTRGRTREQARLRRAEAGERERMPEYNPIGSYVCVCH